MTSRTTARVAAFAAGAAALAFALAGCSGGSGSTNGAGSSAASKPVSGGNLTFAISSENGCIDPQQVGNNDDIAIARQTVASLTSQDPKTGEIKPWLASSWKVNADASSFTFTLRTGTTYADGTPIDAESVKENFAGIQALGAKATLGSTYLSGLKDVKVIDPQTVEIDFSKPSAQFLQATSTFTLGLVSNASTKLSVADRCAGKFAGSGPFTVKSFTPAQQAVLVKRDGYDWGPSTNSHTGEAYLDSVTFKVVPEASTLTGSLSSGQIDASADVQATDLPQFDGNGFWVRNRTNPGVVYNLYPNAKNPALADEKVRQAISKAIDRSAVTKLLTKWDKPAKSVLSSSTPYWSDQSSLLTQDVSGAKKLLEDDGWKLGSDGVREKGGKKLSFTLVYWQPTSDQLQLVQQELKAVGIELQLKQTTIADATATNDGTQALSWGNLTRADPDVVRTVFSARGTQNNNHRAAEAVDDVLDLQAATTDKAARQKLVDQAAKTLITEAWSIPVFQLSTTIAASDKVHDLKFEASSRLDFYDTWLSK
ncbi:ABC transporter substrate-binding protein [Gryllotalpicola kribbensis]|uniref:ABC transporter substrate-binding protein n=1 Tax=Gryllotalpicola kribbensis TaxID=993084 RepID=A0ABP8AE62_9MICO